MGAEQFTHTAKGKTAREAFYAAREKALYNHGHSGYTGTIAEKTDFDIIPVPAGIDPIDYAETLLRENDPRIDDKWGPAGCVKLNEPDTWLFFGWASS